jgi:hypothetical protein
VFSIICEKITMYHFHIVRFHGHKSVFLVILTFTSNLHVICASKPLTVKAMIIVLPVFQIDYKSRQYSTVSSSALLQLSPTPLSSSFYHRKRYSDTPLSSKLSIPCPIKTHPKSNPEPSMHGVSMKS